MTVIFRLVTMLLAYWLACAAASLVLTIAMLTPDWNDLDALGVQAPAIWVIVLIGAAIIAALATLPSLLIIVLAENFAWRSVVLYGVFGGVLALILADGLDFAGYVIAPGTELARRQQEVLAASGIAGGLVYWLIAGRKAGAWT